MGDTELKFTIGQKVWVDGEFGHITCCETNNNGDWYDVALYAGGSIHVPDTMLRVAGSTPEPEPAPLTWKFAVGDIVTWGNERGMVTERIETDGKLVYAVVSAMSGWWNKGEDELSPAEAKVGDWVERAAGDGHPDAYQGEIAEEDDAFWVLNTGKYAKKAFTRVVARPQPEPEPAPVAWKFKVGDVLEIGSSRRAVRSTFERGGNPWYVLEMDGGIGCECVEECLSPATPQVGDWVERAGVGSAPAYQGEITSDTGDCWMLNTGRAAQKASTRVVARPAEAAPEPAPYVPQVGDIVRWCYGSELKFTVVGLGTYGMHVCEQRTGAGWVLPVAELTLLSRHGSSPACDACERVREAEKRVAELEAERDSARRSCDITAAKAAEFQRDYWAVERARNRAEEHVDLLEQMISVTQVPLSLSFGLAPALQRKCAEVAALQNACRKHKERRKEYRTKAGEKMAGQRDMLARGNVLYADSQLKLMAAETRVAELEAQVGKPLTDEQAGEIEWLAGEYASARVTCMQTEQGNCRCFEAWGALKNYLASLTRPAPAEPDVPDSINGCLAELQAMGTAGEGTMLTHSGATVNLTLQLRNGDECAEFSKTGEATLSDWQAAVRWARGVKESEVRDGW